jgi:uncharacterized protein YbjT (DUF2867 family)
MQHAVFDAAKKHGLKRVVKIGTIVTDKDSKIAHALWHQELENKIQDSGVAWTFIRPTLFASILFEPWVREAQKNSLALPLRNGRVPLIHPKDVGFIAFRALTEAKHEGKTYSITGPDALSMHQAAIILSHATGQPLDYISLTAEQFTTQARKLGMPHWLVQDLVHLFDYFANNRGSTLSLASQKILEKPATFRDYCSELKTKSLVTPESRSA